MRNNKFNRGVEPIIGALLLIVITVFAFGLVYGVYSSWISNQRGSTMLQMQERISVEDVRFSSSTTATLYVSNIGAADVNISSITINDVSSTITSSNNYAVPGISISVTVTYPEFISETTYTFKVITARGSTAESNWLNSVNTKIIPTVSIAPVGPWTMDMGQTNVFTATPASGSGVYTGYQWYVGGVVQTGQTASTFTYSAVSAGSPLITVTVTDSLGVTSVQSAAPSVTVNTALSASVSPASWTMDMGQTKIFSAVVSGGTSVFSYQWYVGGVVVSGETASTFSYAPASTGAKSITVMVTDSAGVPVIVTSSTASVTVNTALVAPTASASRGTVDVGQTSLLSSTAVTTGTSPYTYKWQQKAPGGAFADIVGATSSSYTFDSTGKAVGTWQFQLLVTDSASLQVTSNTVSVTVNAALTVSVAPPGPIIVPTGNTHVFTATASGGTGTLSYQWYLDGAIVAGQTATTYSFTQPSGGGVHTIYVRVTDTASIPVTVQSNTVSVTKQ